MIDNRYRQKVDLLLQVLPLIDVEKNFALQGGTAINLFVRDLPRLSVDVDLVYLPFDDRNTALSNISDILARIKSNIETHIAGVTVHAVTYPDGSTVKLNCQTPSAQVKIEVNPTIRGHLFPVEKMELSEKVQEEFERFLEIRVQSKAELFGGKICAALDRQHPRDLFDIHYLFQNEGITNDIKEGFIASLLSHNRPLHEMLQPNFKDQKSAFKRQFAGMSYIPFSYKQYEASRKRLIEEIKTHLNSTDKELLMSFISGEPVWSKFRHEQLRDLPAVQWKLKNIKKLIHENPVKHQESIDKLTEILDSKRN